MEKAKVTWMGKENQSELDVDIKDPKAEAKRIDDYMNNEVDLIPDSSRNIQYPRKMTKFVEVPIGERKNPSKKEYKTFEVFALNRDEAITHLKDGYADPLYMPPQLTGLLFAWIFFSSALLMVRTALDTPWCRLCCH